MIYKEISVADGDGDYYLPPFGDEDTKRVVTVRPETTITIDANADGATVELGYEDYQGNFKAYPDSDITTSGGKELNHGIGVKVMAQVSGITANSVHLAYSSS